MNPKTKYANAWMVLSYLQGRGIAITKGRMMEDLEMDKREIDRYCRELRKAGKIFFANRKYWGIK